MAKLRTKFDYDTFENHLRDATKIFSPSDSSDRIWSPSSLSSSSSGVGDLSRRRFFAIRRSRFIAEFPIPNILQPPAGELDLSYRLPSLAAETRRARDVGYSAVKEKIPQSDLFSAKLDKS